MCNHGDTQIEKKTNPLTVTIDEKKTDLMTEDVINHVHQQIKTHIQETVPKLEPTQIQPLTWQAPPRDEVRKAPKGKFDKEKVVYGRLKKREVYSTRSDIARMGFKEDMARRTQEDLKKDYDQAYRKILEKIDDYTKMDTSRGGLKIHKAESKTVREIMGALNRYLETAEKDTAAYKEALMQKQYFDLMTGGYLEVEKQRKATDVIAGTKEAPIEITKTYDKDKKKDPPDYVKVKMEDRTKDPLFPHEPSILDIRQGSLGDCYLLAGLASIVNASPQFIKECMADNGNGTVTVRFFKGGTKQEGVPNPPLVAHYVTVKKTVPTGWNAPIAEGSLWVQMVEKAYVASGLHVDKKEGPYYYEDIAGGFSGKFIFSMTGREMHEDRVNLKERSGDAGKLMSSLSAQREEIYKETNKDTLDRLKLEKDEGFQTLTEKEKEFLELSKEVAKLRLSAPGSEELIQKEKTLTETETELNTMKKAHLKRKVAMAYTSRMSVFRELFGLDIPVDTMLNDSIHWNELNATIANLIQAKVKNPMQVKREGKTVTLGVPTIEHVKEMYRTENMQLTAEEREKLIAKHGQEAAGYYYKALEYIQANSNAWLERNYQHTPFSKEYTQDAIDAYEKIERSLKQGKTVSGGSQEFLDKTSGGPVGLNREMMQKGLVEGHAYTILGVEITEQNNRYVRLRNPWGTLGRSYTKDGGKVQQEKDRKKQGFFLMEFNEFLMTFDHIDFN